MTDGSEEGETGVLKNLIILIIVIIILLYFSGLIYKTYSDRTDARICRDSIELHAAGKLWGLKSVSSAFRCPAKILKIKDSDQDKVKKQIADSMAECFWKFGENKYDLFSGRLVGQDTFCALCSQVKFENKNAEIQGFRKYLIDTGVPVKYGDGSYLSYLRGIPTDASEIEAIKADSSLELSGSQEYGIMYLYTKNEHISKWLLSGWGAASGALIGTTGAVLLLHPGATAAIGIGVVSATLAAAGGYNIGSDTSADWQSAVVIVPYNYESLKALGCTQLPIPGDNK